MGKTLFNLSTYTPCQFNLLLHLSKKVKELPLSAEVVFLTQDGTPALSKVFSRSRTSLVNIRDEFRKWNVRIRNELRSRYPLHDASIARAFNQYATQLSELEKRYNENPSVYPTHEIITTDVRTFPIDAPTRYDYVRRTTQCAPVPRDSRIKARLVAKRRSTSDYIRKMFNNIDFITGATFFEQSNGISCSRARVEGKKREVHLIHVLYRCGLRRIIKEYFKQLIDLME